MEEVTSVEYFEHGKGFQEQENSMNGKCVNVNTFNKNLDLFGMDSTNDLRKNSGHRNSQIAVVRTAKLKKL